METEDIGVFKIMIWEDTIQMISLDFLRTKGRLEERFEAQGWLNAMITEYSSYSVIIGWIISSLQGDKCRYNLRTREGSLLDHRLGKSRSRTMKFCSPLEHVLNVLLKLYRFRCIFTLEWSQFLTDYLQIRHKIPFCDILKYFVFQKNLIFFPFCF